MKATPVNVTMVEKGSGEREMRILRKNRILLLLFIGLELRKYKILKFFTYDLVDKSLYSCAVRVP